MKSLKFLALFFVVVVLSQCSTQHKELLHSEQVREFQTNLDKEYLVKETTPLRGENFEKFKGHPFFPISSTYRVVAKLERIKNPEPFEIPTSSGKTKKYQAYAKARFSLGGKPQTLTLYQSLDLMQREEYRDYLFLPFRDSTNGKTTYGGGRYLDLRLPKEGEETLVIDFNKAYMPYCAYNAYDYSCPVVPEENILSIPIKAGTKYKEVYF